MKDDSSSVEDFKIIFEKRDEVLESQEPDQRIEFVKVMTECEQLRAWLETFTQSQESSFTYTRG
jgi:hypothetical protein